MIKLDFWQHFRQNRFFFFFRLRIHGLNAITLFDHESQYFLSTHRNHTKWIYANYKN